MITAADEDPDLRQGEDAEAALPPVPYGHPTTATRRQLNPVAVLSPLLAIVVPPAGPNLGHWALAKIRRSGEAGRTAALWGLGVGYFLTALLVVTVVAWVAIDPSSKAEVMSLPRPEVTASTATVPSKQRVRLDLSQAEQ